MSDDQYLTQTQIGKRYGNLSARKVGTWLKNVGLRKPDGEPTKKAIEGRFCKLIRNEDWGGTFWVWHATKTLGMLEASVQNPAAFLAAQAEEAAAEAVVEEIPMDDEEIEGDEGNEGDDGDEADE
jgi:hypothetical protein